MHELLFAIVSVINPFDPSLLHLTQLKSMARMIRLSRLVYFLYRRLEVVTTHVRVTVEVACTWRYTCVYAKTYMSLRMLVFHKSHTSFLRVHVLRAFKLRVTCTITIHVFCVLTCCICTLQNN